MKKGIKLIIAATISYAIYIQFSNKMGNIWYRSNSLGKKYSIKWTYPYNYSTPKII